MLKEGALFNVLLLQTVYKDSNNQRGSEIECIDDILPVHGLAQAVFSAIINHADGDGGQPVDLAVVSSTGIDLTTPMAYNKRRKGCNGRSAHEKRPVC
jgi:hypothetical protein